MRFWLKGQRGPLGLLIESIGELGDKASRLLSFQLKKAQASRTIPKIKQPHSNEVETSSKAVANTFAKYYKQLYKGQHQELNEEKTHDFFKNLKLDKLTADEAPALVEPIKEKEVKDTIIK